MFYLCRCQVWHQQMPRCFFSLGRCSVLCKHRVMQRMSLLHVANLANSATVPDLWALVDVPALPLRERLDVSVDCDRPPVGRQLQQVPWPQLVLAGDRVSLCQRHGWGQTHWEHPPATTTSKSRCFSVGVQKVWTSAPSKQIVHVWIKGSKRPLWWWWSWRRVGSPLSSVRQKHIQHPKHTVDLHQGQRQSPDRSDAGNKGLRKPQLLVARISVIPRLLRAHKTPGQQKGRPGPSLTPQLWEEGGTMGDNLHNSSLPLPWHNSTMFWHLARLVTGQWLWLFTPEVNIKKIS